MRKEDDSSLTRDQYVNVRAEAKRLLTEADAIGRFPTQVDDIMEAAKVEEIHEDVLNENFIIKKRDEADGSLKKAIQKVLGLFDAISRFVFIDRSLHEVKQTFIRLHETGHGYMAWQREIYKVIEECNQSLNSEIADLFDREANVFASEVLFQLDNFTNDANRENFEISVPVKLSKKYGASIYASVRRYVSNSDKICAVIILNKPEIDTEYGFKSTVRRFIASSGFCRAYSYKPPDFFTPDDKIGSIIPMNCRGSSDKHLIAIKDDNGVMHEFVIEAFGQSYQIFVLMHEVDALTKKIFLLNGP